MKERGIVLRDHEVRCVLAGAKTQLRRVVKQCAQFRRWDSEPSRAYRAVVADDGSAATFLVAGDQGYTDSVPCPYGALGVRPWVKEAFNWSARGELAPGEHWKLCPERTGWRAPFCVYRADGIKAHPEHPDWGATIWKSSTQMPRWASRITLEVTGVRVERLHGISEEDADAEGVLELDGWIDEREIARKASEMRWCLEDSRAWFAALWEETNGKTAPWSDNPFVWVVEFKVAEVTGRKEAA